MIYVTIILAICLIIIFVNYVKQLCIIKNQEQFENLNIYATRLFGLAKYVRLNKFNRAEAVYVKPPLPKTGESRCDVVSCPDWIPDNSICYKCM